MIGQVRMVRRPPVGLLMGVVISVVLSGCGGDGVVPDTEVPGSEGTPVDSSIVSTTVEGAGESPGGSAHDPCTILTVEEINQVFPGNDEPLAAEGEACLYRGLRIDLSPLTLDEIEAEAEPTGWEVRPLDIEGADWAVLRIDTNETEYEKVLDVLAGGANGTVHLIADFGTDVELGSATHDGMVDLLEKAMGRL